MNYSKNVYQAPKVDPSKQEKREKEFPETSSEVESNKNQREFEHRAPDVISNPKNEAFLNKKPADENI